MEQWSEGIYLLGQYDRVRTGCWLLTSGKSAAILEFPPFGRDERSPVEDAYEAATELGVQVKFILCTHFHEDHMSAGSLRQFMKQFPKAKVYLQEGFDPFVRGVTGIKTFKASQKLTLDGEPLYLIHAPKNGWTDTMVIFRGVIFTGDWELNTIRSIHDESEAEMVPVKQRIKSIEKLAQFPEQQNYTIHKAFSAHADDRREGIDFVELMEDTKVDRRLW